MIRPKICCDPSEMMHIFCISNLMMSCCCLQVGWYSDNSGLHIDLDEDGSFPDYYEDENEIGVTQIPKFTEKVRSSPLTSSGSSSRGNKFPTTTSLEPIGEKYRLLSLNSKILMPFVIIFSHDNLEKHQ